MAVKTRRAFNWLALGITGAGIASRSLSAYCEDWIPAPDVPLQPLAAQVKRLRDALAEIGDPLTAEETVKLDGAFEARDEAGGARAIQGILDAHVLLNVEINPEDRVSLTRGAAKAQLVEQGWRTFLVKVINNAGDTSKLMIECPESLPMGRESNGASIAAHDGSIGAVDARVARMRWAAIELWDKPPIEKELSGLRVEYRILQVYSRDRGQREASFCAQTTATAPKVQYQFFYSFLPILFDCLPSKDVSLNIKDDDGAATTARLLITDALGRVYPAQGKRALPDLWFERHVYRRDGETLRLPEGKYSITFGRGPEYLEGELPIEVKGAAATSVEIKLARWIQPGNFGYYSGDTHIHAAGCWHYDSPSEGVTPEVMYQHVRGEGLDVGDVLTWGGGFYYQRQFFTGHVRNMSDAEEGAGHERKNPVAKANDAAVLRYDLEVSGFPSSHCGHLVLLRLADQRYPGTRGIDDWPSWNLPILKWAKAQGVVAGYAHSGFGLIVDSEELPNYLMPRFDGIGANEYIVDITHGVVDFISTCDTLPHAELNIWYHTLNCGFRKTLAGETDFPCLTDERVGEGRSYVKLDQRPSGDSGYDAWVSGLKQGRSYVGDGRSHLFNFSAASDGLSAEAGSELHLPHQGTVKVRTQVSARLEKEVSETTERIRRSPAAERPHWHIERARLGAARKVPVELIVNGVALQRVEVEADGIVRAVEFDVDIPQSSWIALRILPSSHTNPLFVRVGGAPQGVSRASAEWCRRAVDTCWEQKSLGIRPSEMPEAEAAYDYARRVYDRLIASASI
jgi:hypothetical protein